MFKEKLGIWLWALAFLLMVVSVVYQRRSGPTYPLKGSLQVAGQRISYSLPRSAENTGEARIAIPDAGQQARVLWRLWPSDDPFTVAIMAPETDGGNKMLTAGIPPQEAAGKVEYRIEVGNLSLPEDGGTAVLRFKGPVSTLLLVLHIILIFAAMLTSTRAGLGAIFGRTESILPWVSLCLILIGGLFLGVLVQKAAFGAYWTGWPNGSDPTDNKTALMFLAWLAACGCLLFKKAGRTVTVLAAAITIAVYVVPHSWRGSEYNYQQGALDTGQ